MSPSSVNFGAEQSVQSVDSVMLDAPEQIVDDEMTDVSQDRNAASSEDGIEQFGRGRRPTSSADQGNLYNSGDDVSCGGKSISHGQEDLTSEASSRGCIVIQFIFPVDCFGPQGMVALNIIPAAPEHQCSSGPDGEDTVMAHNVGCECERCKARE